MRDRPFRSARFAGTIGGALRLFVHPVVLGSGARLFDDGDDLGALELAECRAYDSGVVSLSYQPRER
jgi:dihydrofolate reductase